MVKFIKSDFIVTAILLGTWVFYLTYDGSTRFDISQTITLPLLMVADFTALAILYVVGRYYFIKKKGSQVKEFLRKPNTDNQAEQEPDKNHSKNNKS